VLNKLTTLINRFRTHGIKRTLQSVLSVVEDRLFDIRLGVDTAAEVEVENLGISDSDQQHSVFYMATRARHLRAMFNELAFPANMGFVDLGCGKARTLIIASKFPFSRLTGIEISEELCSIANQNLDQFTQSAKERERFEIVSSNILNYQFQPYQNVFYLFRPFDEVIMRDVLANIDASLKSNPRNAWIVLSHCQFDHLFESNGEFKFDRTFAYGGAEFKVFKNH